MDSCFHSVFHGGLGRVFPRRDDFAGGQAAQIERLFAVLFPLGAATGAQEVAVVFQEFFEARATFVSLISVSFDVPLARLPSRMFCLPDLAAWTIWSWVRLRGLMNRSQKRTVASKTILAFWKESRLS